MNFRSKKAAKKRPLFCRLGIFIGFVILDFVLPPSFAVIAGNRAAKQGHRILRWRVLIAAAVVWAFRHELHLLWLPLSYV
ncbi:hypothetical protein GBL_1778 [Geobacillus kaustophilus GBlys]|uniref:Uncharacterized protein n=1 Tax=Geobacillus kaustophilus GBlys TaxID=1337888 RepID=U2WS07_GEOKU|nr:hypothetical protein GBL_1778 [Geobacillus kaustophilus GBlys]